MRKELSKFNIEIKNELISENDRNFLKRVYSGDTDRYTRRIKSIGFLNKKKVLDIGCGFGQWSFAMAELNNYVLAIDVSKERIELCNLIKKNNGIENIDFVTSSIETFNQKSQRFDAVFAYSSLYFTDFTKTFQQIYDVLEDSGHFYLNTNDIGWYFFNVLENHNPAQDFNARSYAMDVIQNSLKFYSEGVKDENIPVVMPKEYVEKCLKDIGFEILSSGSDASISVNNDDSSKNNFYPPDYYGYSGVYEILCKK